MTYPKCLACANSLTRWHLVPGVQSTLPKAIGGRLLRLRSPRLYLLIISHRRKWKGSNWATDGSTVQVCRTFYPPFLHRLESFCALKLWRAYGTMEDSQLSCCVICCLWFSFQHRAPLLNGARSFAKQLVIRSLSSGTNDTVLILILKYTALVALEVVITERPKKSWVTLQLRWGPVVCCRLHASGRKLLVAIVSCDLRYACGLVWPTLVLASYIARIRSWDVSTDTGISYFTGIIRIVDLSYGIKTSPATSPQRDVVHLTNSPCNHSRLLRKGKCYPFHTMGSKWKELVSFSTRRRAAARPPQRYFDHRHRLPTCHPHSGLFWDTFVRCGAFNFSSFLLLAFYFWL